MSNGLKIAELNWIERKISIHMRLFNILSIVWHISVELINPFEAFSNYSHEIKGEKTIGSCNKLKLARIRIISVV